MSAEARVSALSVDDAVSGVLVLEADGSAAAPTRHPSSTGTHADGADMAIVQALRDANALLATARGESTGESAPGFRRATLAFEGFSYEVTLEDELIFAVRRQL